MNTPAILLTISNLLLASSSVSAAESVAPVIPLCPGMKIVTAINQPSGDYESIKRLTRVSPEGITLHYSSEHEVSDPFSDKPPELVATNVTRTILSADQSKAAYYMAAFSEILPETLPNSTAITASTSLYTQLKQTGKAEMSIITLINGSATSENVIDPNSPFRWWFAPSVYALELADKAPVKVPVLVNGIRTDLPALHVNGQFGTEKAEFFILDDPKNPLMLKFRLGFGTDEALKEKFASDPVMTKMLEELAVALPAPAEQERLQVTQITFDCHAGGDLPIPAGSGKPVTMDDLAVTDAAPFPSSSGTANSAGGAMSGDGGSGNGKGAAGGAGAALGNGLGLGLGDKAAVLEKALVAGEKVAIYDIFFSFNSAIIRPESDETLSIIADLLAKHSDWKLAVSGHTDSIASDDFNLELSKRRAAAVKDALVTRFKLDAGRLSTQGYGEASPRDTNDTLEGRARNRRVELVRQ
jgi:outer membrane protein OmpA-like peptidoglycan-associated protein